MRIVFMGTPEFARQALEGLVLAGHELVAVYSQPPKPAGRGQKLTSSPVHQFALTHSIPVYTPTSLKTPEAEKDFAALKADLVVVAAYGLIIPAKLLAVCPFINIHASLLPRWRGAAPIQRAILAGDTQTGITIMKMDVGLDTGDMLASCEVPILSTMTAGQLHDQLAQEGSRLCVEVVKNISSYLKQATKQDDALATYAAKIQKSEAKINFAQSVNEIDRHIRAFNPYPGAYVEVQGEKIKILEANYKIQAHTHKPGDIIDAQFIFAALDGFIMPQQVQRMGKNKMSIDDFLRGFKF